MKHITLPRKALSTLTIAVAMGLSAFAAQAATTSEGLTCVWGDASFEGGCGNASAAANAKAKELARLAYAKIAAAQAATTYKGTLYRNGGYFGEKNSDFALERGNN